MGRVWRVVRARNGGAEEGPGGGKIKEMAGKTLFSMLTWSVLCFAQQLRLP
jgi:hypothetical protein